MKKNARLQTTEASALDKPHSNLIYPAHRTQAARLLAVLLHGQKIHPLAGWKKLGIYRLSDTVFRLRKLGWPVRTGHLHVRNRFGEPCRVAHYELRDTELTLHDQQRASFMSRELQSLARKEA